MSSVSVDLAIELQSLSKSYGTTKAVDQLSLEIPVGSVYGIIGPNGSGKTTTLRMILRIIEQDEGKLLVFGKPSHPTANNHIAYLPEERGLYRKMPVLRQLIFFGQLKGMSSKDARASALDWLKRFDLESWADKKLEALSKGMSQKVQFIATVIANPRLVILDEPFSGLDPVNMEVIREEILRLRETGTTFIFSTHDMPIAEELCDRICMIYRGQKVLDGTMEEIQSTYGTDTLRLGFESSDGWTPEDLDGVELIRATKSGSEYRFQQDPELILRAAISHGRVNHYAVVHPTLHDIFVRIARPTKAEINETSIGDEHA